jgi:hypothetical protein
MAALVSMNSYAFLVVAMSPRAMGSGLYFRFRLLQGSLYPDDVRNFSLASFLHGREAFDDRALARRSWTFLCLSHD